MSAPYAILQSAVIAQIRATSTLALLSGIYDGPPARAAFPYVSIGSSLATDWSTKTEAGREIRLALTLWDDGDQPARLHSLLPEIEAAVAALPRSLSGWRIASLVLARTFISRDPQGPWAGLTEHRIRLLQL